MLSTSLNFRHAPLPDTDLSMLALWGRGKDKDNFRGFMNTNIAKVDDLFEKEGLFIILIRT